MIQSTLATFFPLVIHTHSSSYKNSSDIVNLVMSYLQDQSTYDRNWSFFQFTERHRSDPFKAKPLRVCYMNNSQEMDLVRKTLTQWKKKASEFLKTLPEGTLFYSGLTSDGEKIEIRTSSLLIAISEFSRAIVKEHTPQRPQFPLSAKTIVALDASDRIQALAIFDKDKYHKTACLIYYLMTSPYNVRKAECDANERVEGAATALIEECVVQSLSYQQLGSRDMSQESLMNAAVRLKVTGASFRFYSRLFFEFNTDNQDPSYSTDMILTGQNVMRFLDKHAGRAAPPSES